MINDIYTTDYTAETLTSAVIATFIRRHVTQDLPHLKQLYDYYCGYQAILDRVKDEKLSNERLVINHAAYIADFTSGYLRYACFILRCKRQKRPACYTADT